MADGAVNFLLGKLSIILGQTVLQKASLLSDAQDEIEEIKLVFESMSAFIRDADRRKETDLSVKTWVRQVREISHKIEDIVDEYMHYNDTGRQTRKGFKNFVQDVVNLPRNVTASYQLTLKLQEIKKKIQKISERSKEYCFNRINEGPSRNPSFDWRHHHGESSSFVDEKEMVGMDESKEKLLEWLTEDEVRRTIISIVGMGGLGKTTLVTKVYNDQIIKRYFDCWAWISVSQTYGVEELLRSMVRELLKTTQATSPRNFGSMNYRQLAETLIDVLRDKRIIFTTRNENVATSVGPGSRVHRLEPLRENDAWVLFCNKVLDVEGVSIEIIPGSLINLFNLSHLNLRDTKVRELPKSMERLHNLQTLDVRNTNVMRLPSRISKLLKLRHFFLGHKTDQNCENSNFPHGMKAPAGIWNARSLQTLSCIEAEEELITQVGNLLELKRLDITELKGVHGPKLCSSIQKLTSLRCLGVKASAEEELKLEALSLPPFFLQKLTLVGQLKNLPHWIGSLANLTHLCLDSSRLEQDVISCLHTLSTLVFLELKKAYGGSFLYFRAGWFPKLNKLNLKELVRLDSVRIEDGALPSIKEMGLIRCWALKSLPQGIEHLRSLRKLHLEEMSEELLQWLESDTSEVQAKVQHISTINHVLVTENSRVFETLR
ncbi:Disease resistance protein RPM1 [Camellia lanceoleosa]|uniref:Disease resistance protein RPM1 n=1 Tax=Camellia lanceoleosa TaxID=1840588 RepID=A0ACC0H9E3_9ERIC|nr:Disease resistance protein RPM1 [Camellia lanceoleosa]